MKFGKEGHDPSIFLQEFMARPVDQRRRQRFPRNRVVQDDHSFDPGFGIAGLGDFLREIAWARIDVRRAPDRSA